MRLLAAAAAAKVAAAAAANNVDSALALQLLRQLLRLAGAPHALVALHASPTVVTEATPKAVEVGAMGRDAPRGTPATAAPSTWPSSRPRHAAPPAPAHGRRTQMKQSRAAASHTRRPVRQMRSIGAPAHLERESEQAHHFRDSITGLHLRASKRTVCPPSLGSGEDVEREVHTNVRCSERGNLVLEAYHGTSKGAAAIFVMLVVRAAGRGTALLDRHC